MRRFVVPAGITAVVIVLLIVLIAGISGQNGNSSLQYGAESGQYKVAPDQQVQMHELTTASTSPSSTQSSLGSYHGKLVLVNMFASWCQPCQDEAPLLAEAQKVLSAHNGTVLGITYQDSAAHEVGFMRRYGVDYPVLQDAGGVFAKSFGVTDNGVPDTYLVSPSGKVVWVNLFQLTPAFLNKTLPQLITKFA